MSRLKSVPICVGVLIVVVYLVFFYFGGFLNSKFSADMAALVGLSFMSFSTLPVAFRAVQNGLKTDQNKYIFSYWLIWTIADVHRIWVVSLGMMKANYPEAYDYWYFSCVSGLIALGFGLAAGYGGAATLTGDVPIPKREVIIFSIAAGFTGIIAGIAFGVFVVAGWVS